MTTALGPLYCWTPESARSGVTVRGLTPTTRANHAHPELVLCTDAAGAWGLDGEHAEAAGEVWCLWQVDIAPGDEVHVQPQWGAGITEVRVRTTIPPHRVTQVGKRVVTAAEVFWRTPRPSVAVELDAALG